MFCRLFCLHFHVSFLFSNSRKVGISTRGAGSIWSLKNIQLCKSAVKNLRYQTQRHVFIPLNITTPVTQITNINVHIVFLSSCPAGYSSTHSSLTDLSHRRSASGGSASTGIGSILEPSEQQAERGERESRSTPPISAAFHHAPERPSTPAKVPR